MVQLVNSNMENQQQQPQVDEENEIQEKLYDLNTGRYDVTVKAGPTYESQREETRETLIEIMRQVPGSAEFIGDILLEHMDFEGAEKVAERMRMATQPQPQPQQPQNPQQPQPQVPQIDPNTGQPIQPQGQPLPQQGIPQ